MSVGNASLVRPSDSVAAIRFRITRSGDSSYAVTVEYETRDGSAKAGVDYTDTRGVLRIPADATGATVQVPVLPGRSDKAKRFLFSLTGASGPLRTGSEASSFPTGDNPRSVAVADFNGDGRLDVAVVDEEDSLSLLLNTTAEDLATPSFAPRVVLAAGKFPVSIVSADFNGDGKPDLAVANENDRVSVLLNRTQEGASTPRFAGRKAFHSGRQPTSIAAGDFNGDGKSDLAVGNFGSQASNAPVIIQQSVSVLLNTAPQGAATASFAERTDFFEVGTSPVSIVTTDLNGDGKPDLAVRSVSLRPGFGFLSALLNTTEDGGGTASFGPVNDLVGTGSILGARTLVVADFDGDGRPDVAADEGLFVNTTPAGAAATSFGLPILVEPPEILFVSAAADLNRDGRIDLVGNGTVRLNTTAENATQPGFAAPVRFIPQGDIATTGDFNGDDRPELVAVEAESDTVSVLVLPFRPAELADAQGTGTIRPNIDIVPDSFRFADRGGVQAGLDVISNTVTVKGLGSGVKTSLKLANGTGGNASFSINNGTFAKGSTTVQNGDRVRLRNKVVSGATASATLNIGGVVDTWNITTRP